MKIDSEDLKRKKVNYFNEIFEFINKYVEWQKSHQIRFGLNSILDGAGWGLDSTKSLYFPSYNSKAPTPIQSQIPIREFLLELS